jgi:membrane protein
MPRRRPAILPGAVFFARAQEPSGRAANPKAVPTVPVQPPEQHLSPGPLAHLWWRVARVGYLRFGFTRAPLVAAAVAFYSVTCLAPLGLLLSVALQRLLGPGGQSHEWLRQTLEDIGGDAAAGLLPQMDQLLTNPESVAASLLSLAMLLWAAHRLFDTLERALTGVWPGGLYRGIIHRKLVAFATMALACLALAALVLLEAALAALAARLQQAVPGLPAQALHALRPRLVGAIGFLLAVLAFFLLYKTLPVQRVPWRVALVGALSAGALWLALMPVFRLMMTHSFRGGAFYGGLAGVVTFSLWAFLVAEVLLLGAHMAVAYEHVFLAHRPQEEDDAFAGVPAPPGA